LLEAIAPSSPTTRLRREHQCAASRSWVPRGFYDEVNVLRDVPDESETADVDGAQLLRVVSPHWLRHACAHTLVVDMRVPLPHGAGAAGPCFRADHSRVREGGSVETREFVEPGFGGGTA
jgi:integrase/recombinase XerC